MSSFFEKPQAPTLHYPLQVQLPFAILHYNFFRFCWPVIKTILRKKNMEQVSLETFSILQFH